MSRNIVMLLTVYSVHEAGGRVAVGFITRKYRNIQNKQSRQKLMHTIVIAFDLIVCSCTMYFVYIEQSHFQPPHMTQTTILLNKYISFKPWRV